MVLVFDPLRKLKDGGQLSARDWKCLMMSQFELGKYAEVKETWALSTEVRAHWSHFPVFELFV